MRRLRTIFFLCGILFAAACADDLGKRCSVDSDCAAPYRCAMVDETHGVCSYPAPAPLPDASTVDSKMGVDAPPLDSLVD